MEHFELFYKIIIVFWPLVITTLAVFYRKKQNGVNPWTGGAISWPKSFWLSYTIQTWFFLPLLFLFHPATPFFLKLIISFHLISWWIRGILEMVMIYKWFNWSPVYGITHDFFHILVCGSLLFYFRSNLFQVEFGTEAFLVIIYILMLFISTMAELSFAYLFLKWRSREESKSNVYFASDDPKWLFINRYTVIIDFLVFCHLFYQSYYVLKYI